MIYIALLEITDDYLEEYIGLSKIELGKDIVEDLSILRDDVEDARTKRFLQDKINKYSEEFKVCSNCFCGLELNIVDETHTELDDSPVERLQEGFVCTHCGKEYDY